MQEQVCADVVVFVQIQGLKTRVSGKHVLSRLTHCVGYNAHNYSVDSVYHWHLGVG